MVSSLLLRNLKLLPPRSAFLSKSPDFHLRFDAFRFAAFRALGFETWRFPLSVPSVCKDVDFEAPLFDCAQFFEATLLLTMLVRRAMLCCRSLFVTIACWVSDDLCCCTRCGRGRNAYLELPRRLVQYSLSSNGKSPGSYALSSTNFDVSGNLLESYPFSNLSGISFGIAQCSKADRTLGCRMTTLPLSSTLPKWISSSI